MYGINGQSENLQQQRSKNVAAPTQQQRQGSILSDIGNRFENINVGSTNVSGPQKPSGTLAGQVRRQQVIEEKDEEPVVVVLPGADDDIDEEEALSEPGSPSIEMMSFSSMQLSVADGGIKEILAPPRPAHVEPADDEKDRENPQMVTGYVDDIYAYLRTLETKQPIRQNYMSSYVMPSRTRVNPRMRAILVDWLVQVHLRFKLLQETLYQTIAILDLFLQEKEVPKDKLQLVGVTSMLIACKYEEMLLPEVADFVYITDSAYTGPEICAMERVVLVTLSFRLGRPIPLHFLRRFSKAFGADATIHTLAKFFMEMTLVDYSLVHIKPSLIAASALRLADLLLEGEEEEGECAWGPTIEWYSTYPEETLRTVVRIMANLVYKMDSSSYKAVSSKYQSSKFMKIAKIVELKSPLVKKLALGEQLQELA